MSRWQLSALGLLGEVFHIPIRADNRNGGKVKSTTDGKTPLSNFTGNFLRQNSNNNDSPCDIDNYFCL